ncbi:hypothetical protein ROLI_003400 [Roseobacter fucihabitans]|uniref:Uncharacterized protein n=1 Tax=Roseobacter fucihabitans TaxID=1537242 RepID=A0ABZ2BNZ6_9RHOB|nr:hypothetical protein [Roseobacter litoralis]MBC6963589.1 hypothetical protein [Roseobacter litoralis]
MGDGNGTLIGSSAGNIFGTGARNDVRTVSVASAAQLGVFSHKLTRPILAVRQYENSKVSDSGENYLSIATTDAALPFFESER